MDSSHILVVDDNSAWRRTMLLCLKRLPGVARIDAVPDGRSALQICETTKPDLVILDISMPNMDGLEAAKYILSIDQGAAILILTMYLEKQYAVRAIRAGALGYITKSASTSELHAAVRTVALKKRFLLEDGLVETGRQTIDEIYVTGKLLVFLLGDPA